MKQKVLFICTHNSARSQMAEAFLNALYPNKYQAFSAGTEPGTINPYVVKVMAELGFDLANNKTKGVSEFQNQKIDYVVTVCNSAKEHCPFFPGAKNYLHHGFTDPSSFTGTEADILAQVRTVRDGIKSWLEETFGSENGPSTDKNELKINLGI